MSNTKVSAADVPLIRRRLFLGTPASKIAKHYDVSVRTINKIGTGESFPNIGGPTGSGAHRRARFGDENGRSKISLDCAIQAVQDYANGASLASLADRLQLSESSVKKILSGENWPTARNAAAHSDGGASSSFLLDQFPTSSLDAEEQESLVNRLFDYFRANGYPFRKWTALGIRRDIDRLSRISTDFDGSLIPFVPVGMRSISACHPHMADANYKTRASPLGVFNDPIRFRGILSELVASGRPITSAAVRIAIESSTRTVSNFRPHAALAVYRRFGARTVVDPCMGWGGRMVGAMAGGISYVGIDPSSYAVAGNRLFLSEASRVCGKQFDVEIIKGCAEDILPLRRNVDLVFTSPPYFDTEHYSEEQTQSFRKFPRRDLWLEGFLRTVVIASAQTLRHGGRFVVNVNAPLVEPIRVFAKQAGLIEEPALELELPVMPYTVQFAGSRRAEPVLVFKREIDGVEHSSS